MDLLERLERWLDNFDQFYSRDREDPEFHTAWEDLERFLGENHASSAGSSRSGGYRPSTEVDPALESDFKTLEVPVGSPLKEVDAGYKRLLRRYHPDRYPSGSARHRAATEVAKRLNSAYSRIKEHYTRRDRHYN